MLRQRGRAGEWGGGGGTEGELDKYRQKDRDRLTDIRKDDRGRQRVKRAYRTRQTDRHREGKAGKE